jgi:isopenicillin N synthase-like dioxygenase
VTELPTVDISALVEDASSERAAATARELTDACHEPGFCYVSGHGVAHTLDAALMAVAKGFFALPESERREIAIVNSRHFRGYTILGDERTKGVSDWRDQLDVGPEEPESVVAPSDPPWLRLRGPNQWPRNLPQMKPVVLRWMTAMERVALVVMRALAVGLGQPRDHFDGVLLPRGDTHLKIIRYPPQRPDMDTGQGVGMHHDSGLLSFILQDAVPGLQVLTPNGLIDARHKPGTYVMNLGEMMQAATGGYLSATKHRVESPPAGIERISIAYFANPRLDCVFEPITLPESLAALARGGQNPDPHDPIFAMFGDNYLKIRLRAHPDVARAHYSDILR